MSEKTSKKTEALITALFSTQPEMVMASLEKIPEMGNARLVQPLVKTYMAWPEHEEIRNAIYKILMQLKTEGAIPELIEALELPEFAEERALIISIFWNAGLFPTEHIDTLVKHAIRGDYMVALEALTVIENIESPSNEGDSVQDAILDLEEFTDENPDAPHTELLLEIKQVLTTLYNL